jgi:uncharacterized protein YjbI with pentapeptide repeats
MIGPGADRRGWNLDKACLEWEELSEADLQGALLRQADM